MSIAGVVLAAGASTRLGTPKQLVIDADGETLVHRAARQLVDAGCQPVFVVVGAAREAVVGAVEDLHVAIVANDGWSEGVASSIRCAVDAAASQHNARAAGGNDIAQRFVGGMASSTTHGDASTTTIDALLLTTCDMPTVGIAHLSALCHVYRTGAVRVASRYVTADGTATVGIPAIVGADEWHVLLALHGDRGAKHLFYESGTVTVDLAGGSFDVDRPADVQALQDP
jgi:CTP:molybdopterin cytidylyltransferase MocA